ncbi:MAG: hypothetical protein R3F43_16560 [bacterium]
MKQRRRDIQQWGYALEFEARNDQLEWGLQHGAASGDKSPGFGVLDKFPIDPDAEQPDTEVTGFKFDRDYVVDLILFREIIGAVTNAFYVKPWLAYNFIDQDGPDGLRKRSGASSWRPSTPRPSRRRPPRPRGAPGPGVRPRALHRPEGHLPLVARIWPALPARRSSDRLNDDFSAVEKEPNVAQTLQMGVGMQF